MSPSPRQLDHFALPIYEVEASLRFYRDLLQLPLLAAHSGDDWGGKPWLMLIFGLGDGREIALCALRGARRLQNDDLPKDLPHFAMGLDSLEELERWAARLTEHGIEHAREEHGAQRSIYFEDPNGIMLELTAPPTPSRERSPESRALEVVQAWLRESA